jgi:phosphoglucosamine mutase
MFGTSGIRGIYGKGVTPSLSHSVGNALGQLSKKTIICRDTRRTSPILSFSLSSGAMLSGSEVVDLGVGPTPYLAYVVMKEKCCGAMITASHNPPEYNGIKLFSKGMEFSKGEEKEIVQRVGKASSVPWDKCGQRIDADFSSEYVRFLLSKIDSGLISKRKPKVLVDAGNAAGCFLAPSLLKAAGAEVIPLNCDSPGDFRRNLEPKPSTLEEASKAVVQNGCDFGVAFDGDADRAIAIDEKGGVLALDVQLAIFCSHFLAGSKNKRIVSTVEASLCVREAVEGAGGKIFITPVGSRHVAQEVIRQKAVFGGEPCGEYVFPSSTPCADGLLSALFIAQIACLSPLSSLADGVKTYPIERRKYPCSEEKKKEAMGRLASSLSLGAPPSTLDGLRFDFEDGWLLIRPSGTEQSIRLTCEAKTGKRLHQLVQTSEDAIKAAIGQLEN